MKVLNLAPWAAGGIALFVMGCSGGLQQTIEEQVNKRDAQYKSSRSLPPLEVPPDLASGAIKDTMVVPESETTFSEYASADKGRDAVQETAVLPTLQDLRIERNGDKRWLVVRATPAQVWPKAREFWFINGFLLKREDASIGIMETDWAENRADIPKDFIRTMIEKITTSVYSATTRDKFRVRLERGSESDSTELYITHRGAEEVAKGETFVWQPRPSDPELEAEMLSRMMVYFGMAEEQARTMMSAKRDRKLRSRKVRDRSGAMALSLEEDFSRAWRRTGLALDRVGFTVEDRDRSRGLYFVRYVDPNKELEKKDGILSKLKFWDSGDDKKEAQEYLISIIGQGASTQVVILNKEGKRESGNTADSILGLLHDQLK